MSRLSVTLAVRLFDFTKTALHLLQCESIYRDPNINKDPTLDTVYQNIPLVRYM